MIHDFQHWLPAGMRAPEPVQTALSDMVDAWSREWFAGDAMRALGLLAPVAGAGTELRRAIWHMQGGLAVGVPEEALAGLGAQAMGVEARAVRTPADLALLERLGSTCLDDLKQRAATLFQISGGAWNASEAMARGPAYRLEIGARLTLQLSAALFAQFVRSRLSKPAAAPLGSASQALAGVPVRLSAALGRCGISVAELSDLASGDVLVLEPDREDPLPLALEYRALAFGTCTVAHRGEALALQIVQAPTR